MITATEYFTRPDEGDQRKRGWVSPDQEAAADGLLERVNRLLLAFDTALGRHWVAHVRSGFRSAAVNARISGAAKNSLHMSAHAIDIADNSEELDNWLSTSAGLEAMVEADLYREHHTQTLSWTHLQDLAPRSGKREYFK
jgi:hypothetical protein